MTEEANATPAPRAHKHAHNGDVWIITGGRNFTSQDTFNVVMSANVAAHGWPEVVAHRGHVGADEMAEKWAEENGIETIVVAADYARYGSGALKVRNEHLMALKPARVIIFFNGIGNADLDRRACEAGVPVINVVRTYALDEVFKEDMQLTPPAAATAAE